MKRRIMLFAFVMATQLLYGQITFRNDFIINRKLSQWKNKGLTYVTFNVGSRHSWNLNAYGQASKSIRVDVAALLGRKAFLYQDVIESMYRPMAVFRQSYSPIPWFLLMEPIPRIKTPYAYFSKRARREARLTAYAE